MRRSTVDTGLLIALGVASIITLGACGGSGLVADTAASLVWRYCATPALGRAALREAIALSIAPNKIRVECAADAL